MSGKHECFYISWQSIQQLLRYFSLSFKVVDWLTDRITNSQSSSLPSSLFQPVLFSPVLCHSPLHSTVLISWKDAVKLDISNSQCETTQHIANQQVQSRKRFLSTVTQASTICKSLWTEIPLFSVRFEVTAQLRAAITEIWPKSSREKGRESHFQTAHWDRDLTFVTFVSRAQRVLCHLFPGSDKASFN